MSTFTVKFECDNAAFEDSLGVEISCILGSLAKRVEGGLLFQDQGGPLRDTNGNTVGQWKFKT